MKARRAWLALGAVLLALAWGLAVLYRARLGAGDVFPRYSTLRADPLGTRALYESLAALPGLRVERSLAPLRDLPPTPPRTLVLAGMTSRGWDEMPVETRNALDAAVRGGTRLVIAFEAERHPGGPAVRMPRPRPSPPVPPGEEAEENKPAPKEERLAPHGPPRERPAAASAPDVTHTTASWERLWGVELYARSIMDRDEGAVRPPALSSVGPVKVPWKSDLYFKISAGTPWRVCYTRDREPVLIELAHGRGSIVLASDAYFLSNEALQQHRAPGLLAWLIGDQPHVVFAESHLGVIEVGGVAALARRYGLTAAFGVFVLLAALYIWREATLFVPPPDDVEDIALDFHPTAGLEALLRRAVAPAQLFMTCVAEWRRTARPTDVARVEAIDARQAPPTAYNAAVRALRRH
jgi:hypothetical protein